MTFEELLDAANAGEHPRLPGQWTPTACRVWREADPEMARLLEAALAGELTAQNEGLSDCMSGAPPEKANCSGACFALKLAIRLSAIRAVSGKVLPCDYGVLAISDAA
jgi:hypothetical protein